jgi:hypothetical protein
MPDYRDPETLELVAEAFDPAEALLFFLLLLRHTNVTVSRYKNTFSVNNLCP